MEPDTFMTLETLKTLAGQVLAVGLFTQMLKASVPNLSTYLIRLASVVIAVTLQVVLIWQSEMRASAYALAVINGALVAASAMKAAEMIKGDKNGVKQP